MNVGDGKFAEASTIHSFMYYLLQNIFTLRLQLWPPWADSPTCAALYSTTNTEGGRAPVAVMSQPVQQVVGGQMVQVQGQVVSGTQVVNSAGKGHHVPSFAT